MACQRHRRTQPPGRGGGWRGPTEVDDSDLRGRVRDRVPAGLGHDRDESDRLAQRSYARAPPEAPGRAPGRPGRAGQANIRSGLADRGRRGEGATARRRDGRRAPGPGPLGLLGLLQA